MARNPSVPITSVKSLKHGQSAKINESTAKNRHAEAEYIGTGATMSHLSTGTGLSRRVRRSVTNMYE